MIYYFFFFLIIIEALGCSFYKQLLGSYYKDKIRLQHCNEGISKAFLFLAGTELILLYSLRDLPNDSIHDLGRYVSFFYDISYGADYSYLEPGFRGYMYLCSFISNESIPYILFTFVFPVICLTSWFIYKYSKNVFLSIYIYYGFMFYFFLFNGVRQCIAMALSLPSFYFINEKKWIKAIVFIGLAISFHKSAIILLILFILRYVRIKIDLRYFLIVTACSLAMVGIGRSLVGMLTSFWGSYSGYLDAEEFGNWANPIIYLIIIGIICLLNNGKSRGKELLLINSVAVGTLIYFMSTQVQILNRMAYFFTIPIICVLPNVIYEIRDLRVRLIAYAGCYGAITIYGCILILQNAHGILPYVLGV